MSTPTQSSVSRISPASQTSLGHIVLKTPASRAALRFSGSDRSYLSSSVQLIDLFRARNSFTNFCATSYVFSLDARSSIAVRPYRIPITIRAPETAPHVFPVCPIPPPRPQESLRAVFSSMPKSFANAQATACEHDQPLRNNAAASSPLVVAMSTGCPVQNKGLPARRFHIFFSRVDLCTYG